MSIIIKSRDKIDNNFAEPMVLNYGKIKTFEYGYELENIEDKEEQKLIMTDLYSNQNIIHCRIYNKKDID